MASFPLPGRTALITGASRGIGLETARRLHARGTSLVLTDLDRAEIEAVASELGGRAIGLAGDATDRDSLDRIVAEAVDRFGGLDLVVANAGVAPPPRTLYSIDPDAFERVLEVNLLGVWRTVRAALPQIVEHRGQVVVIASIYAFMNGTFAAPYAASKAAVEQLGRALRVELAAHGAGATVVYPGFVDTRMVRETLADDVAAELEATLPSLITRRITPERLAVRIVAGIERRQPRVILPRWWAAYSILRGMLSPLTDRALARDERVADAVRRSEH